MVAYLGARGPVAKRPPSESSIMARKAAAAPKIATPAPVGPVPETVQVTSARIACDGVGGALGHPRVWLQMGEAGFVECP